MGLKNPLRRRKSSKRLARDSVSGTPTPRRNGGGAAGSIAAESNNSTIATKQTSATNQVARGGAAVNPYQHPDYAKEQAPPTMLPTLGLSHAEEDDSGYVDQVSVGDRPAPTSGYLSRDNIDASQLNDWQREAAGTPNDSVVSGSVFDGLTLEGTYSNGQQGGAQAAMVSSNSRDLKARDRMAVELRPTRDPTPTQMTPAMQPVVVQRTPDRHQADQFDPPQGNDPPEAARSRRRVQDSVTKKARKSHALRQAMRREISRHRGQSSHREVQSSQPPIVAEARNRNKSTSQKIADIPSTPTKSGEGSLMMNSAAPSRNSNGNRSRRSASSKSTALAGTAAVVGVTAVGAAAVAGSSRSSKFDDVPHGLPSSSKSRSSRLGGGGGTSNSRSHETNETGTVEEGDSYEELAFPETRSRSKDDDSVHDAAGSFCSCGGTYDEYDDEADTKNDDTVTYDDGDTYDDGTYDDGDTYDEGTYENDPPEDGSIADESYMSGSYIDEESYVDDATYNSDDGTRVSLDPPAKDGTWASWFGFGGGGSPGNDGTVGTATIDDDSTAGGSTVGTATVDEEGTVRTADDETVQEDPDLAAKEDFDREIARNEERAMERERSGVSGTAVAAGAAIVGAAAVGAAVATHDREGRPLPESKPVKRVSSFKKMRQKLIAPVSPGGKSRNTDKTVTSEETPATASTVASKDSTKETEKASAGDEGGRDPNAFDKRFWDKDVRQRDIYCGKHGGVENLVIRQYPEMPTPNAPDHLVVAIEASTVSSKDCVVRVKGEAGMKPEPAVPGFHIVGQVAALGSKVNSTAFRKGDRVAALLPDGGGNAKYISIPTSSAILLPENANHQDIICLVANYMTAYQCLKLARKDGLPLTGANVLITGGSGPVGQALVELALREGAKVYATAHKMHEEHLTKLGAKWFSVRPKKWLHLLEGKMDVVIDSLCVDGYESSYRALTPEGMLVCNTGNASALQLQNESGGDGICSAFEENGGLNSWWGTVKAKYFWSRAIFYDLNESYDENPRRFGHELHYLIVKLQRGEICPKVAGKVSLNQVPKAQKLIEKGLPNGTVVCLPWKKLDPKQKVEVQKIQQ